jgi:serpin B
MRRRRFLAATAALGGVWAAGPLAAACGDSKTAEAKQARADLPRTKPDEAAKALGLEVAAANAAFGWDLYGQIANQTQGNLFFSPFSIGLCMAMVYGGARANTAAGLAQALHFDPAKDVHAGWNALDRGLSAPAPASDKIEGQQLELSVANSAWGQDGFDFRQAFLELLARDYGAGLYLAEFAKKPEAERKRINNWVEDMTRERIKDLLPEGSITGLTRLVLANAIYFKANWRQQFTPEATTPGPFTRIDGSTVQTPMMRQTEGFNYAKSGDVEAIELPYAGGTASMVILLPAAGGLKALEQSLANKMDALLPQLKSTSVQLAMPRWEFTAEFRLREALAALGASDAFDEARCDLSGIAGEPGELVISDVYHKAFVKVDEKGTEAAAATAAVARATSARVDPVMVTLDRPFLFLNREKATGGALFAGRVVDPTV